MLDYVFDDEKFGGNAQSFSSDRCCHHTSFLWDYDDDRMRMLSNPKKQPDYRRVRDFFELCDVSEMMRMILR